MEQFFDEDKVINSDGTVPVGRRHPRLGPPQRLLFPDAQLPVPESSASTWTWRSGNCPRIFRKKILHGTGEESIEFRYLNDRGDIIKRNHPFEGIIPNMERRYRETESDAVREDLLGYMSTSSCPSCNGSRLREAARHVFIEQTTLPDVVRLAVGKAHSYFSELSLPGSKGEIADKILKEIRDRLQFLVNVGLEYLTLERSAKPCPVVRRNVSIWPARSARAWSASCTYWMSLPSACTSATTSDCSIPSPVCAIWATQCWWWNTTKMPSGWLTTSLISAPVPGSMVAA